MQLPAAGAPSLSPPLRDLDRARGRAGREDHAREEAVCGSGMPEPLVVDQRPLLIASVADLALIDA